MRSWSEHREQTSLIHGIIDNARKLSASLGIVSVFFDKRPDAIDRVQKVMDEDILSRCLTKHFQSAANRCLHTENSSRKRV